MQGADPCPICSTEPEEAFQALVLAKHSVRFYSCAACGLLRSEEPYWLDEAYGEAIGVTDTGLVARNLANRALLEPILHRLFRGRGKYLDLSGGYGLLARLLRDAGFDCYTTDPYCANLFAKGFEPAADFAADALFAFEVLEHVHEPVRFLVDAFERFRCRTLVFSTETFVGSPPPQTWWYYQFKTGQHVTFYQRRTLQALAEAVGVEYRPIGAAAHLFTDRPLSSLSQLLLLNPRVAPIYRMAVRLRRRRRSLTWDDHLALLAEGRSPGTDSSPGR